MAPKKRIDGVNAVGIISKAGKYNGGTCAHKDIALRFASWIPLGICCSPCSNLLSTHYLKFEQTRGSGYFLRLLYTRLTNETVLMLFYKILNIIFRNVEAVFLMLFVKGA